MKEYNVKVLLEQNTMRLDIFLAQFSNDNNLGFSRTLIQKLIHDGKVFLGSANRLKPHYKVKAGEEIKVIVEEKKPCALMPENISLEIVYEDNDLAIINKPSGLVVHPAPGNY